MAAQTLSDLARELNLSRSALRSLERSGILRIPDKLGPASWTGEQVQQMRKILEEHYIALAALRAESGYKTITIENRRYLGNKYKLTPFIRQVADRECPGVQSVADLFAGTGAVASAFLDKKIITNDVLYSNYICHVAWFGPESYDHEKIIRLIGEYNAARPQEDNYMSRHFADTYFSREVCRKIGFIREDIERRRRDNTLNDRERALLVTSLLYAMDHIANTCGHYDAYRDGHLNHEKQLELCVPLTVSGLNPGNQFYHLDANQLAPAIQADLVYIDPPYNSRQYCDAYHLLENVACWDQPDVTGKARKMKRGRSKSDYCTSRAASALEDLLNRIQAKYILLSYNNMGKKGNARSNAKISDQEILRALRKKGEVKIFSEDHRAFSAGKSSHPGNKERLFLCICSSGGVKKKTELIPSPLNYTGGKFQLLPQLLPHFPRDEETDQAVDLFCGGCSVGMNLHCPQILLNDVNRPLMRLLEMFQRVEKERIFAEVQETIRRCGLSDSQRYGYAYYHCDSSKGLAPYNREKFLKLREEFNRRSQEKWDDGASLLLYVLVVYSFNNQIRFNQKGEFNLPAGKRDFNARMSAKLSAFLDRLQSGPFTLGNQSFSELNLSGLTKSSFVYADPPYLITCATYNEQDGWNESRERELLAFLDRLQERGVRFALSNVLRSKGKENTVLLDWLGQRRNVYRVIPLSYSYANSSYHTKDKASPAEEVLIVNYPPEAERGKA